MHLAGKRYFGANMNIGDEEAVGKYREMINRVFYLGGLFIVSDAIPWLEWMDLGGHIKEMKRVGKGLHLFMSSWLEEHRQWRAANPGHPNRDFIDIMLASLKKPEFAEYDPDIVVIATRVWEDTSEFRRERFLTGGRDMDFRGQNFEFLPFGSGRRKCPGSAFAGQVMHCSSSSWV